MENADAKTETVPDIFSIGSCVESRSRVAARQKKALMEAKALEPQKRNKQKASFGPMDITTGSKAGKAAQEEHAAHTEAPVEMDVDAGADVSEQNGKKKNTRQAEMAKPAPPMDKEEAAAQIEKFKLQGGVVTKIGRNNPDRSKNRLLRLGSMLGVASQTSDLNWCGDGTLMKDGFEDAVQHPFSDNMFFGTIGRVEDRKTVVMRRPSDNTEFEKVTSDWKYQKMRVVELREFIAENYKDVKDHTALNGSTHLSGVRTSPMSQVMYDQLLAMGRLSYPWVPGMEQGAPPLAREQLFVEEIKFQCHDISLEDACKIAADERLFNKGFYLIDFDATVDLKGVVSEDELSAFVQEKPGWSWLGVSDMDKRQQMIADLGPLQSLQIDNGHTTGHNSFTFITRIPLDSVATPSIEGGGGGYGVNSCVAISKFYNVPVCRLEKASVASDCGSCMYPLIASRFNRFAEAAMNTRDTGWMRFEKSYKINKTNPVMGYKLMPSADKIKKDLCAYRDMIPNKFVYKTSHAETAKVWLENRKNSVVAIDTWYDNALVTHSVAAATGALAAEPVVAKFSNKAHHVLGLMPSHEVVDVVACVRGGPYVTPLASKTDKVKLSQVEKDAMNRVHKEKQAAANRKNAELLKAERRDAEFADIAKAGQSGMDVEKLQDWHSKEEKKVKRERNGVDSDEEDLGDDFDGITSGLDHDQLQSQENAIEAAENEDVVEGDASEQESDAEEQEDDDVAAGAEEEASEASKESGVLPDSSAKKEAADRNTRAPVMDLAASLAALVKSYKLPPGYLGFITFRIFRANKKDSELAPLSYLTNPKKGAKLFTKRETEEGIPAGFNRNGTYAGDPIGSLPEFNDSDDAVKNWLLNRMGFTPSALTNIHLESGDHSDKCHMRKKVVENVELYLSEHPYLIRSQDLEQLTARKRPVSKKARRLTDAKKFTEADEVEAGVAKLGQDLSMDVDRSRGRSVKLAAAFLEEKICKQAAIIADSLAQPEVMEELAAFKSSVATTVACEKLHDQLARKPVTIASLGAKEHKIVAIRCHSHNGQFGLHTDEKNEDGKFVCMCTITHVAAGIAANIAALAGLKSPVKFKGVSQKFLTEDDIYHDMDLNPFAVLKIESFQLSSDMRGTKLVGKLTLLDGTVLWDSGVPMHVYKPKEAKETNETMTEDSSDVSSESSEPAVVETMSTDTLPPAMKDGAQLGKISTADTKTQEKHEAIVAGIMSRWDTPPKQKFLQLADSDLVLIKKMKAAVPLPPAAQAAKEPCCLLRFLGRTAVPIVYKNQFGIVAQWQRINVHPNLKEVIPAAPFYTWIDFNVAVENVEKLVESSRLAGVGALLYTMQDKLVPGAVFHIKGYAGGKHAAPWGLVYSEKDWANHIDYRSLPAIKKGETLPDSSETSFEVEKVGKAHVYPQGSKGGKDAKPNKYAVVKTTNGVYYKFAQPDVGVKFGLSAGCTFDTKAWRIIQTAASSSNDAA